MSKFTDEEIERNRVKHKFIFEKALKMYLNSNMNIKDFLKCFNVRYNANVDNGDFDGLYSFNIERLNDENENGEIEDKNADDREKTNNL